MHTHSICTMRWIYGAHVLPYFHRPKNQNQKFSVRIVVSDDQPQLVGRGRRGRESGLPLDSAGRAMALQWEKLSPQEFQQLQDLAACKFTLRTQSIHRSELSRISIIPTLADVRAATVTFTTWTCWNWILLSMPRWATNALFTRETMVIRPLCCIWLQCCCKSGYCIVSICNVPPLPLSR